MNYNEAATRYAELKAQADALAAEMADLAQELRQVFTETGEQPVVDLDGVTVELAERAAYKRQTWNGKLLTGYAAAHPEILAFLTEKLVPATVAISVKIAK